MPLTRRKSALEQAQQVALSFALDDDETIDSFLPDEQVAKEKEKSFALQLQRRPSPTSEETLAVQNPRMKRCAISGLGPKHLPRQ
jgi:hypothetical protein